MKYVCETKMKIDLNEKTCQRIRRWKHISFAGEDIKGHRLIKKQFNN